MKVTFIIILTLFFFGCSTKNVIKKPLKKVALVIGNQSYKDNRLFNPINDANGIFDVLDSLGFDMIDGCNDINANEFTECLEKFKNKLDNNTIAFFYFAGHANTLTKHSSESYLQMLGDKQESIVSIFKVYDYLIEGNARYNIVCLDSCRDFKPSSEIESAKNKIVRGGDVSWEEVKKSKLILEESNNEKVPKNTLIVYSTGLNEEANDIGEVDPTHSPFAKYFIEHLDDEGIEIREVLRLVRNRMGKEFNGKQRTTETDNLLDYIYLNPTRGDRPSSVSF